MTGRIRTILATVFAGVVVPAVASASEEGFLFLMKIGPIEKLAHKYSPGHEPPMVDMAHISVAHLVHAAFAAVVLIFLCWIGTRRIRNRKEGEGLIPDDKVTLKNIAELSVRSLYNLCADSLGEKHGKRFLPFLGTLFIYIFVCNLMGLIPGLLPPTTNININVGMAVCVFLYYHYAGIREHGAAYLKHFMGPVLFLAPLMIIIETISHFVRILSLSVRLFGNMTGDHTVLAIFTDLTKLGVPVIFLGLGLFISFIQALVFTLLSVIYFQLAMAHDH